MDSIELLDELILRGWGDVPRDRIPEDWEEFATRTDHPSQKSPTPNQPRNQRLVQQAKARRHSRRVAAAHAAALAPTVPLLIFDGRKGQTRAEVLERHAAEMRYRNTLQRFTRRR